MAERWIEVERRRFPWEAALLAGALTFLLAAGALAEPGEDRPDLAAAREEVARLHALYDREVRTFREVHARARAVQHPIPGRIAVAAIEAGPVPTFLGEPRARDVFGYLPPRLLEGLESALRVAYDEGEATWEEGGRPDESLRGRDADTWRWYREYFADFRAIALRLKVPPPLEEILFDPVEVGEGRGSLNEHLREIPVLRGRVEAAIRRARDYRVVMEKDGSSPLALVMPGEVKRWANERDWEERARRARVRIQAYREAVLAVRRLLRLGGRGVVQRAVEGVEDVEELLADLPAPLAESWTYRRSRAWFRGAFDAIQGARHVDRVALEESAHAEAAPVDRLKNPWIDLGLW